MQVSRIDHREFLRSASAFGGALLLSSGQNLFAMPSTPIKTVYAVFKCHLDLGFTDTQAGVLKKYYLEYFPRAIKTAAALRTGSGSERYVWTVGSWLLTEYLEQAAPAQRKQAEGAIIAGDLAWHAIPMSWESEMLDESLLEAGLGISAALDRRFGRKTTGAKLTDVPGHTRGLVGPLTRAGVTFLDIGVNPASTPPEVIETKHFLLSLDSVTGAVTRLQDRRTGREWATPSQPLGLFAYQTFSAADYTRFLSQCLRSKEAWAPLDFGKPGLTDYLAQSRTWHPVRSETFRGRTDSGHRIVTEMFLPEVRSVALTAWPQRLTLEMTLPDDDPAVHLDFQWLGKAANRLPEALWLSFQPVAPVMEGWRLDKSGHPVAPRDVVSGGGRSMHAVTRGVSYSDAHGKLQIDTLDAPLVAPGRKSLLDFDDALPDLSPDGVHPGTIGYDKIARAWYQVVTGLTPPPLPSAAKAASDPGRLDERNVFSSSDTVTVSSTFAGSPLPGPRLVDGTPKAFVFGSPSSERVAISGFHGQIGRLRFFDTPSYTGRTPGHVTVYASPAPHGSLKPGDYSRIGDYPLPTVGNAYENQTSPAAHPDAADPASHPAATIGFYDLNGLHIPPGTQSLLLDFSKSSGDGDGLSEIQAFALTAKK